MRPKKTSATRALCLEHNLAAKVPSDSDDPIGRCLYCALGVYAVQPAGLVNKSSNARDSKPLHKQLLRRRERVSKDAQY